MLGFTVFSHNLRWTLA